MNISRLTTFLFSLIIGIGLNVFSGADELLNERDQAVVRGKLSGILEELDITNQGFRHYCDAFKNSNSRVDPQLLNFMVEDTWEFASGKLSRSFADINQFIETEMSRKIVKKKQLRMAILGIKRDFVESLQAKEVSGIKKQLFSASLDVGFEERAVLLFRKTLSEYKENSLELCEAALNDIFGFLSSSSSTLKKLEIREPLEDSSAQIKPVGKKKKKKKKKKKLVSEAPLSTPEHPLSQTSVSEEKSDFEGAASAQSVLIHQGPHRPAGAAAAAQDSDVEEEEDEEEDDDVLQKVEKKSASVATKGQPSVQKGVSYDVLRLEKKEVSPLRIPRALEETFQAIWHVDCSVDSKDFVSFWEHFGFLNTQKPALGNEFFILQHANGYKLKTSHAPHSKEEKVFKMSLSFAKNLLGSSGITNAHDAEWQEKLRAFLQAPCTGMRK